MSNPASGGLVRVNNPAPDPVQLGLINSASGGPVQLGVVDPASGGTIQLGVVKKNTLHINIFFKIHFKYMTVPFSNISYLQFQSRICTRKSEKTSILWRIRY